ncbi:GMC family oxidoreductase [Hymenobacter coalescens]
MILSTNTFAPDHTLTADVCIIGSGPAAISLALRLNNTPLSVVMITGGAWTETLANQDLYRGSAAPAGSHEPLEENRRRQFGGSSAAWGGRCIPFEPVDFKPRAWVPDSGWPFRYEDLLPYYRQAADLCQIGRYEFSARSAFPAAPREILPGMEAAELTSDALERWSPPVHFGKTYQDALESSPNIRVLMDAHVLALRCAGDSRRVSHVRVTMGGQPLTVAAGRFVLAAGGIENARLLLASTSARFPTGLGNELDNVGRYYMGHYCGVYADLTVHNRAALHAGFERDQGVYCRRRWWIPEPAQQGQRLLNCIFFLYHPRNGEGHRDVLFSSRFVAKTLLFILSQKSFGRIVGQARQQLPGLRSHLANIARHGLVELPELVRIGLQRMAKRRLPYLLPSKHNPNWGLYFQGEQAPHRESRICLSATETDAFGMPRAEVRMAFQEEDLESIVRAHQLFVERFRAAGAGDIRFDEQELRRTVRQQMTHFNSAAHHIGTTRMSDDPRTGVVDGNAQVYGVDNLFVAGASVFPTGGHANPTLTIVAQALRLADYLRQRQPTAALEAAAELQAVE